MTSDVEESHSTLNLYLAACTVNIGAFAVGCAITWSSPTIFKLKNGDLSANGLSITDTEGAWIASLIALGAAIGPLIARFLVDRIGRKRTILFAISLLTISWLIIGLFPKVLPIYLARVLAGISVGLVYTVNPLYIAEISEPRYRSSLGTLMQFFLCTGFLVEYVVGPHTTYSGLVLVSIGPSILCLCSFILMPETPQFLLKQPNSEKKALESLSWLRGHPRDDIVKKELNELKILLGENVKQKTGIKELFGSRGNIKALLISCIMVGFQQVSGINVVLFYSESIFKSTGSNISSSTSSIIVGSVMVLAASITPPFTKIYGMKVLLYISTIGMTITLSALGFYFFLQSLGHNMISLSWLPITCLVLYIITYCFGIGPLPWAIMGEMFPANLKAIASALTTSFCWILGFILTNRFMILCDTIGQHFTFWIFSGFCILAFLFSKYLLPNTEGMTLQEIQDMLHSRITTQN
ncbi:facilitated trehalose transporter Tret1-like [Daktulosphaira vitifoliae]|uniref:facilitated trehalose transporter Tret1-like n=1 Tax=Daktulosphaira vitifoliae TaxID=58002 RepID=UPI0021A9CC64|nr:facilitated trehalose transporter Tret1-like [Daktulosphaira vitifoliae]